MTRTRIRPIENPEILCRTNWADRPLTPAAFPDRIIHVLDQGPGGSLRVSADNEWKTLAPVPLARVRGTIGIVPSGTINTGASDNITLGTALPRVVSEGLWMYLPAIGTTDPTIAAGYHWVVMSSTTEGTIYGGDAPVDFETGDTYTQTTGSDIGIVAVTVPGEAMGENGSVEMTADITILNSANDKIVKAKFDGAVFGASTLTTSAGASLTARLTNRGAQDAQVSGNAAMESRVSTTAPYILTKDTSGDLQLTLTGQLENAAEYLLVERCDVVLNS